MCIFYVNIAFFHVPIFRRNKIVIVVKNQSIGLNQLFILTYLIHQHFEYFPFGEIFYEARADHHRTPYLFNGKELDKETGLYYYGARYYDPQVSVWYGVDILAEKHPDISPYCFSANNPIKLRDVDGKDWTITTSFDNNGNKVINISLKAAVLNSSGNSSLNMSALANQVKAQVINSYSMSYMEASNYEQISINEGLDRPANNIIVPSEFRDVKVMVDVDVRVINNKSSLKSNEHLIEVKSNKDLPGLYGKVNKIGGKEVYLNERLVPNMINGKDMNTIPHELGHTGGMLHPDTWATYVDGLFPWNDQQYMDEGTQKANKNNMMFSGGSKYMNDLNSIDLTPEQIGIMIEEYNDGNLNQ